MKKINILVIALGFLASLSSCNKFLDTPPDKRMTLNRADKIAALLTTAYPKYEYASLLEHRTDNVIDNGDRYQLRYPLLKENYFWEMGQYSNDERTKLWKAYVDAVGTANTALAAIEEMGDTPELQASKGEALLCRAWAEFLWVNIFGQAYNSQTSTTDLGVPYLESVEKKLDFTSKRLTVAEVYKKIEKDILAGLPLIDDSNYASNVRKYHFNKLAGYAFAAEFYLFYEKWAEAKKYATLALGDTPMSKLRDIPRYKTTSNYTERHRFYIDPADPANLLLTTTYSSLQRYLGSERYAENDVIVSGQIWDSKGPWGGPLDYTNGTRNNGISNVTSKQFEIFEFVNKAAGTGYTRQVMMSFTSDRALLIRAEAEVLLGEFDAAAQDLSMWYVSKGGNPASAQAIADYYAVLELNAGSTPAEKESVAIKLATISKPLKPKFAQPLQKGLQYNLMQGVLHAKRIEGSQEGIRWFDIKRYGIEVVHYVDRQEPVVLKSEDPRRAIQVPDQILSVGILPNPMK